MDTPDEQPTEDVAGKLEWIGQMLRWMEVVKTTGEWLKWQIWARKRMEELTGTIA